MDTKAALRRILPPVVLFAILAALATHENDLLVRFGNVAVQQAQVYFRYIVQIGIWLSAAYLLNRLLAVFFWEGLIKRALGGTPPRLLRDVRYKRPDAYAEVVATKRDGSLDGFWGARLAHTMIGLDGLDNLERCAHRVFADRVPGVTPPAHYADLDF